MREVSAMAVVNVPPDNRIYRIGAVPGTMHVYNVGQPAPPNTTYDVTILNVNVWLNQSLPAGHTHSYPANGNMVFIQNHGPSRLQVLYVDRVQSTAEAGWSAVDQIPST
jgi:hypothetical protein